MIKKIFRMICAVFMMAAFLGFFGAAGASDCEMMAWNRIIIQMLISGGAMVFGFIGLKVTE